MPDLVGPCAYNSCIVGERESGLTGNKTKIVQHLLHKNCVNTTWIYVSICNGDQIFEMNGNFRFKLLLYEIKQEKMAHFNLTVGLRN